MVNPEAHVTTSTNYGPKGVTPLGFPTYAQHPSRKSTGLRPPNAAKVAHVQVIGKPLLPVAPSAKPGGCRLYPDDSLP